MKNNIRNRTLCNRDVRECEFTGEFILTHSCSVHHISPTYYWFSTVIESTGFPAQSCLLVRADCVSLFIVSSLSH